MQCRDVREDRETKNYCAADMENVAVITVGGRVVVK